MVPCYNGKGSDGEKCRRGIPTINFKKTALIIHWAPEFTCGERAFPFRMSYFISRFVFHPQTQDRVVPEKQNCCFLSDAGSLEESNCRWPSIPADILKYLPTLETTLSFLLFSDSKSPQPGINAKGTQVEKRSKHCWHPNSRHVWCRRHVGQSATSCHLRGLFCWSLHWEVHLLCFSLWPVLHTLFVRVITEYAVFFYCHFSPTLKTPNASHREFHLPNLDSTVRLFETLMTGHLTLTHCLPVFTFISPQHPEIWILSCPHYSNHSSQGNCCPPSFAALDPHGRMGYGFAVHSFGNVSAPFWIHDNTCIWFSFEIFLQTLNVVISADFSFLSSLLFTLQFSPIFTLWGILCMLLTPLEIQTNTLTLHEASPKFNFPSSP